MIELNQPFELSKAVTLLNGMLPLDVYHALYRAAACAPGCNIVEIGTAHGASAVALCLGMLSSGRRPHILTADLLEGRFSSRVRFGGVEENRRIILDNFKMSGVSEYVDLFVGSSLSLAQSGLLKDKIDLLFLDADGRIDIDLINLAPFLRKDAVIIIDDINDYGKISISGNGVPFIDLKHRISALLLNSLSSIGVLTVEHTVCETAFCRLSSSGSWSEGDIRSAALECYRNLVFTEVTPDEVASWSSKISSAY